MFEPSLKSLTHSGKFVEIWSVGDRRVSFDRLDFYHNESQLFGVDTRACDAVESSSLLESLVPFLEQGIFQPPGVDRGIALADGRTATRRSLAEKLEAAW